MVRSLVAAFGSDHYRSGMVAVTLIYLVIFTGLAWRQHEGLRTHKADLGQIDQAIWNSSQGRFLEFTEGEKTSIRLTDHVEPILVSISPIFRIWNDVRALLLLQVAGAVVGAWFLYSLALTKFDQLLPPAKRELIWHREPLRQWTRPLALAVTAAYLLAPQLQSALLTEFHAIPMVVPLILWAFWAIEKGRWRQFAMAALLVAAVKEEAALLAAGLGFWVLLRMALYHRGSEATHPTSIQSRSGPLLLAAAVSIGGLTWFYVATFVVVPTFATEIYQTPESAYFQRYGALGNSPGDIVRSVISRPAQVWQISLEPARRAYVLNLLAAGGFLSLAAPEILFLALPLILANSLSSYPAQFYGEFHYSAPLAPYIFVSVTYGSARIWRLLGRRSTANSAGFQHWPAAGPIAMATIALWRNAGITLRPVVATLLIMWIASWSVGVYVVHGHGPGGGRYDPTPVTAHDRLLGRFIAQLPATAAVTATAALHPHVSHRRFVYQFPAGLIAPGRADYALLDVTTNTDMAPGDLKGMVDTMLAGEWGVIDAADGFLLLQRGSGSPMIPDAFYTFARTAGSDPAPPPGEFPSEQSAPIAFGPLTLTGVTLEDWPRWRQTKVTSHWRVEESFIPGVMRPWLELRTPDMAILRTLEATLPPALTWYPPQRWQPGENIRITSSWLSLPIYWATVVGVVQGADPANRIPVRDQSGKSLILNADGTLAVAATYGRISRGNMVPLPRAWPQAGVKPPLEVSEVQATLRIAGSPDIALEALLPSRPHQAGRALQLWLRWSHLPRGYVPFVHLRRSGVNQSQQDGPPRYFLEVDVATTGADWGQTVDWRALPVAAEAGPGDWSVVIGLYDPRTGERATVRGASEEGEETELVGGRPQVTQPAVPDQACALIPATCAGQ